MSFSIRAGLAAVALASAMTIAQAQTTSEQDHTAHHPDAPAAAPAQRPAMRAPGPPAGMGPRGGQQMMMAGEQADMMRMMLPMMRMMMMTDGGMEGMPWPRAMMQPRHVEGRIAFLKAELKITDAQSPQWNAFADAQRESAKTMITMRGEMMGGDAGVSAPDAAEREVKLLSARLEALKAIAAAETALYGALSDEQKKIADELLSAPMGRR